MTTLRDIALPILRGGLPFPDLGRRLRVRRDAKALVTCRSWPEDEETTSFHIAQLAMLRTLWLQRETRRLTRGGHREAAAVLSRAALETCILGLYCLCADDAVRGLRANELQTGLKAIAALVDDIVPYELLKEAVATLGTSRQPPTVKDMAKHIDGKLGGDRMTKLYGRVYGPVSNYFAHPSAGSLIRHVRPGNRLSGRPRDPWVRRSPVRLADASVGLLAEHLARYQSMPADLFASYAQAHQNLVLPPFASLLGKRMGRKAGLLPLGRILVRSQQLQAVLSRPELSDEEREALLRQLYKDALALLGVPDEALLPIVEYLVQEVVREYAFETRN
ncbi:hypothetical protein [Arthrobacter sp. KNU40]|uniref:hypothetical protein n=1 Tax=Arthrobacter sp. KNU40 TaxID=3447965 RepID=UPI003F629F7D